VIPGSSCHIKATRTWCLPAWSSTADAQEKKRKEKKRKEKKRKEKKRKEKKRKEKTMPFGVSLVRSQLLYWAAQDPLSERCSACSSCHTKATTAWYVPAWSSIADAQCRKVNNSITVTAHKIVLVVYAGLRVIWCSCVSLATKSDKWFLHV